jgi:hypothetical protein
MSAINVNSITGRTGSHGPVLTGVTTITGKLNADSGVSVTGVVTATSFDGTFSGSTITGVSTAGITSAYLNTINDLTYPTTGPLSNRNLIINGAMTVMQRNTTSAAITDNVYLVQDRMHIFENTEGGANLESSNDVPAGVGFSKSLKWDVTSSDTSIGAGQYAAIDYRIEGLDHAQLCYGTAQAKTIAVSFWAKSTLTGPFGYSVRNNGTTRSFIREFSLSAANTWERITLTIPGCTDGTWLETTGIGAYHQISLAMGSDYQSTANSWNSNDAVTTSNQVNLMADAANDFYLTGWQVEAGERSTPFEHRSYGDELAKCQRYLFRVNGNTSDETAVGSGHIRDTNTAQILVPLPVSMREYGQSVTAQGLDVITGSSNHNVTLTASLDEGLTMVGLNVDADVGTPFTTGRGAFLRLDISASNFLQVSSEI